ncbi:unnamed protein product [Rodentolepis nana]|uniref:Uncharacterized protein n=1 Tax=Rodentolepis nana TaxID=102285 RepID=A0A158QGL2_RODNA|nr:unnamed protein product [Rodentolepis nana]
MVSLPDKIDYLQTSKKNILLELKLITASHLIELPPNLQHCLGTDTEILHLLGIINPNSTDISNFDIEDNDENNLVRYLDHFSFFIELLSTFEQEKLSESCALAFEKLFFCRLCQSFNKSIISEQKYDQEVPQVVFHMGSPCPHRCLNVIRGCYASLTGILPQLSQLTKDFIDLGRVLTQRTSRSTNSNGGAFLHNYFLNEMRAWSKRLEKLTRKQWKAINEKVKHRCTGNPPVERIDPRSTEGRAEVADFLWPATERALQIYESRAPANRTATQMWPLIPSNHRLEELRREQKQSYIRMEELIVEYMLPERLFGEHLGQPCLMGRPERCWNGTGFEDEYEWLADFTRVGQLKNPEVKVTNAELNYASSRLGQKIAARSQAIRALVHKTRRRSTGEAIYDAPAALPFPSVVETQESELISLPTGQIMDIDGEGDLTSPQFSDLDGSSGMPPDYIGDLVTILNRQQQLQQLQNQSLKEDSEVESANASREPVGESPF